MASPGAGLGAGGTSGHHHRGRQHRRRGLQILTQLPDIGGATHQVITVPQ
jgi:hypothetical protein